MVCPPSFLSWEIWLVDIAAVEQMQRCVSLACGLRHCTQRLGLVEKVVVVIIIVIIITIIMSMSMSTRIAMMSIAVTTSTVSVSWGWSSTSPTRASVVNLVVGFIAVRSSFALASWSFPGRGIA